MLFISEAEAAGISFRDRSVTLGDIMAAAERVEEGNAGPRDEQIVRMVAAGHRVAQAEAAQAAEGGR